MVFSKLFTNDERVFEYFSNKSVTLNDRLNFMVTRLFILLKFCRFLFMNQGLISKNRVIVSA